MPVHFSHAICFSEILIISFFFFLLCGPVSCPGHKVRFHHDDMADPGHSNFTPYTEIWT